eukprot:jgi/Ulvmu1/671/UM010_0043.1
MLLIDKPLQWTSQDVCGKLKRTLDVKKIGHAGTLDPLATGLLIVCIGKGTKSSELFMASDKVYTGTLKLGEETPSYDAETAPCAAAAWEHVTLAQLQAAAEEHFVGDIMQVPPAYSAIQVGGQRSHRAVRSGKPLEIAPRPRHVSEFALQRSDPTSPLVRYRIRCGRGTYVRSLVHDLGQEVGCKAHVTELRRCQSGDFDVAHAWDLGALVERAEAAGMPRPFKPKAGSPARAPAEATAARETDAAARETDAAARETDAAARETDAAARETDAAAQGSA